MIELQETAELAAKYVNTTDRHIFLTGKAGTGKTTFLKYIVEHTYKNTVIAAPTGIAAINAGGVTLHSLLQLPFGTFIPENVHLSSSDYRINTPETLFREARFNANKRKLIQELELLIIDEVSMLRADLLDCIDHSLRHLRKRRNEPFGGLQILFIGDLMQLPPVVKDSEMNLLRSYYSSPYFFESRALKDSPPILVELSKIYRQTDQDFIDLLNRFRHNEQTEEDLQQLNKHHEPDFDEVMSSGYIHLTTHNHRAFQINMGRLQSLEEEEHIFQASIEGDFPENMLPTDEKLVLKQGAQVMFIKNDPSGEGKFFNGRIGSISRLREDEIWVKFEDGDELLVDSYKWENKRYTLNSGTNEIEEKYLGSFEQFPLKLAWAVTIHKSQGLTFEKAILDLSGTFAPGQLYVALSRLTSLKYMVLSSLLPENPPGIDGSLKAFASSFKEADQLEQNLENERREYLRRFGMRAFDFSGLIKELGYHERSFNKDENRSIKQHYLPWTMELINETRPLDKTGDQFANQVQQILTQPDYLVQLQDRVSKAEIYFTNILTELSARLSAHKKKVKKENQVKAYVKEVEKLEPYFEDQKRLILKFALLVKSAADDKVPTKEDLRASGIFKKAEKKVARKDKTPTAQISYDLYREGKTIPEIAETRGLVVSTIEGHMATYVENGLLDVTEIVESKKLNTIMDYYAKGVTHSGDLKATLGNDYSYGEIKLAQAHVRSLEEEAD
ncbi:MAG: helix-turn-helix domain-containing protein [Cyclobacteriaceae bacterium]